MESQPCVASVLSHYLSLLVPPSPCSQRAVSSRTGSRVCRRGTWLNPGREQSKGFTFAYISQKSHPLSSCWRLETLLYIIISLLYLFMTHLISLLLPYIFFLVGSSEDSRSNMWRRGHSEKSPNSISHWRSRRCPWFWSPSPSTCIQFEATYKWTPQTTDALHGLTMASSGRWTF